MLFYFVLNASFQHISGHIDTLMQRCKLKPIPSAASPIYHIINSPHWYHIPITHYADNGPTNHWTFFYISAQEKRATTVNINTPGILTLGARMEHQEQISEEWTDIWLSIKTDEIEHNRPRSEDTVTAGLKVTNTRRDQSIGNSRGGSIWSSGQECYMSLQDINVELIMLVHVYL